MSADRREHRMAFDPDDARLHLLRAATLPEALAAAGVTRGCNPPVNDRFCPADLVTRGQMAAFLYRTLD